MDINTLDPMAEFADPDPQKVAGAAEAAKTAADAAAAEKAELAETIKTQGESVTTLVKEMGGLREKAAVLDKLQEVLGTKPVNPEEEFVTKEIRRRLGADLEDLAKIKALLPQLLEIVGNVAEEKSAERISNAQESLASEMKKIGLDPDDEDTFKALEDSVTSMIQRDEKLLAEWSKGNHKQAVSKAFDRLQTKLYAPLRSKMKSTAVRTLTETPRSTPRGGAPGSAPTKETVVDTRDTSRESISKIHDAAFDRYLELLEK